MARKRITTKGQKGATIASAGNVLVPAYLALRQKGYVVRRERVASRNELWYAQSKSHRFIAEDTVTLLGLVGLFEVRGDNWQATDEEIDHFLTKFD